MKSDYPCSLKGHFLIAMPGLLDPNFVQSVACICENTAAGALGIIINRIHPFVVCKDIFNELNINYLHGIESEPIYIGGPVQTNEVFILHGPPFHWNACFMITPELAISNTRDILQAIGMGHGPMSYIIALGCAGWGEGQLEIEIKNNSWLTYPLSDQIIFETPVEKRWHQALRIMGIDPILLSEIAGNA